MKLFDSDVIPGRRKHYVLVIFDIEDTKRRNKVNKILESYGVRIQYSAFEFRLTGTMIDRMWLEVTVLIDEEKDRLLLFQFPPKTHIRSCGNQPRIDDLECVVL